MTIVASMGCFQELRLPFSFGHLFGKSLLFGHFQGQPLSLKPVSL
jgi:hypothetical protein